MEEKVENVKFIIVIGGLKEHRVKFLRLLSDYLWEDYNRSSQIVYNVNRWKMVKADYVNGISDFHLLEGAQFLDILPADYREQAYAVSFSEDSTLDDVFQKAEKIASMLR